jgi:hypothetical protein
MVDAELTSGLFGSSGTELECSARRAHSAGAHQSVTRAPDARLRPAARPTASIGSEETTGSCSGVTSTAGLGVGSGALGVV